MIGWKPLSMRSPAADLPGRPSARGVITSARPIASTLQSSLRVMSDLLCVTRSLAPAVAGGIRTAADRAADNYSVA